MLVSYHVHSTWSDGKSSIPELIRMAGELGLDEIGISDHYVLTPNGTQEYFAMPLGRLDDYVEDVQRSSGEAADGLVVRLGLEVDYFPETECVSRDLINSQPFDYVIGSIHFVNEFPIDDAVEPWERLTQDERNREIRGYWDRLRQMAESGLFDIAGHIDLPKKFGFSSTEDLSAEIDAALDAIAAADMAFEVNASGWYKPCREQYPNVEIIHRCFDRRIPVLVTSDAHVAEDLIRGFEDAYSLIEEMGFTETAVYAGRMRKMQPIR